jgi:hypothetical protein
VGRECLLGQAEQQVGRPQLSGHPAGVGVGQDVRGEPVGRLVVGGGEEAVAVVPVELAEVPVHVDVAHHRVVLVADPGVVEVTGRDDLRAGLAVVAVVRVAHAQVMADLVDLRRGQAVAGLHDLRRDEREDVALGTVLVVVVGVPERRGQVLTGRVVEHGQLVVDPSGVVPRPLDVLVVVEEQVGERRQLLTRVARLFRDELRDEASAVLVVEREVLVVVVQPVAPAQLGQLVHQQVRRDVLGRGVHTRPALVRVAVQVDRLRQIGRQLHRVQRRGRHQQVQGDVPGELGQVTGQRVRRPEAALGVLPDRWHAVVLFAVAVHVQLVDDVVGHVRLGPGGQVLEPHAARRAETGLLVVGGRAAPRDHLAAGPVGAEVVAGVGVRFAGLGVDVELEV